MGSLDIVNLSIKTDDNLSSSACDEGIKSVEMGPIVFVKNVNVL